MCPGFRGLFPDILNKICAECRKAVDDSFRYLTLPQRQLFITWFQFLCCSIYYRFIVRFPIGLDFLFITFTIFLLMMFSEGPWKFKFSEFNLSNKSDRNVTSVYQFSVWRETPLSFFHPPRTKLFQSWDRRDASVLCLWKANERRCTFIVWIHYLTELRKWSGQVLIKFTTLIDFFGTDSKSFGKDLKARASVHHAVYN